MNIRRFACVVLFLFIAGCSSGNYDKHDRTDSRGTVVRCLRNEDCKVAGRCEKGFCEDLYFPRKNIKNY